MVDWDQVEKLRGKGWDWDRIASDDRVAFQADQAAGDAGRQLRTLYYQRRSKAQRRGSAGKLVKGSADGDAADDKPPFLLRAGYLLVPTFGIWAALALVFPSPVGVVIPWADLGLIALVCAALLLYALFTATVKWEAALRTPLVLGVVLGLVAVGGVTVYAEIEHCPTLTNNAAASEPNGWARYSDPAWTQNGAPVFFFYGSIACPYCSASSWSMYGALKAFGTLTGWTLAHSNPGDVDPNTPEVDLSAAALQSQYVALNVYEGTDDNQITTPSLPTCETHSYVETYDSGGSIPFVVIGGNYVHAGASLIDPQSLINGTTGQPYTPQQVQAAVDDQSGPIWQIIAPQVYTMEAILVKCNGGNGPSSVTSDPNVQSYLNQLK